MKSKDQKRSNLNKRLNKLSLKLKNINLRKSRKSPGKRLKKSRNKKKLKNRKEKDKWQRRKPSHRNNRD